VLAYFFQLIIPPDGPAAAAFNDRGDREGNQRGRREVGKLLEESAIEFRE
jgi:hypothetical protein